MLDKLLKMLGKFDKQYDKLMKDIERLKKEYDGLRTEHEKVAVKYDFVGKILSSKPIKNENFEKFKEVYAKFEDFQNEEDCLAEENAATKVMQGIMDKIRMIVSFPNVYGKNIIAIGGGFSSGKSEFANSFFEKNERLLAIGIEPTTAIPTYITTGLATDIKGYSKDGGIFGIDENIYKTLSHQFIKEFNFNLKDILPVMAIETPLKNYDKICFVDTPGYNPSSSSETYSNEDRNTANEYLDNAKSLIWMIGLDATGTFPKSDLDFISSLDLSGKKLYVVANKADLKSKSDLEKVLADMKEHLKDNDIDFEGISAFSAIKFQEICFEKKSLWDFLAEENRSVQIKDEIISEIEEVMDLYKKAITDKKKSMVNFKKKLTTIENDFFSALEGNDDKISGKILDIKKLLSSEQYDKWLKDLEKLRKEMTDAVRELFISFNDTGEEKK